jgi:hypothetical protein
MSIKTTFGILLIMITFSLSAQIITPAPTPDPTPEPTGKPVYFSFASDDEKNAPTFDGTQSEGRKLTGDAVIDLMVDVNNDANGGIVTFQAKMDAEIFILQPRYGCGIGSNFFSAVQVKGTIEFSHFDPTTTLPYPKILTITFTNGVLSSYSPSPLFFGETMSLEVSESVDPVIQFTCHPMLQGIGVNNLTMSEDLAFTFTHVRTTLGGTLVGMDTMGYFMDDWKSEGSFSDSAIMPVP